VNETDLGMVCAWPGIRGSTHGPECSSFACHVPATLSTKPVIIRKNSVILSVRFEILFHEKSGIELTRVEPFLSSEFFSFSSLMRYINSTKVFQLLNWLSYYESNLSALTDHQVFSVHSQYFVCSWIFVGF